MVSDFHSRSIAWFDEDQYGALKADDAYRKLWVSLLGSQLAVGQNKLIDKWKANN